jgi:hypothetical protein
MWLLGAHDAIFRGQSGLCASPFEPMAQSETKFTSPGSLMVDAILVIAFFLYLYSLVSPHVPSNDTKYIVLWGGLCSACMSGVFWLALQMFRVVLRNQRAARK